MAYDYEWPYVNSDKYNLDWILSQVKKIMEEWAETKNEWKTYKEAYDSLYKEITDYINNLNINIAEEVEKQLPSLIEQGAFQATVDKAVYSFFEDKKVVIIGDSISDNNINPPNWTTYLETVVDAVGGSVVNKSVGGYGFDTFYPILNTIPTADIYVIELGVNDYGRQYNWSGNNGLETYVLGMFNYLKNTSPNALIFYISPFKDFQADLPLERPLIFYRSYLEYLANYNGACVISGWGAPFIKGKVTEGIHPNQQIAPVLAQYIMNHMAYCQSTFTPYVVDRQNSINFITSGIQNVNIIQRQNSDLSCDIYMLGVSIPVTKGDYKLAELNDTYSNILTTASFSVSPGLNGGYIINNELILSVTETATLPLFQCHIHINIGWNVTDRIY